MKILLCGNLKGGVGKTFFSYNLAGYLAKQGKKVLIMDADAQCNITDNLRFDTSSPNYPSMVELFETNLKISELICKRPIQEIENIDLIPSNLKLLKTEIAVSKFTANETIIRRKLNKERYELEREYDYIIIDIAPSLGIVVQNMLTVADEIIIVSDTGKNAYKGIDLFYEEWSKMAEDLEVPFKINTIVINKVEQTKNVSMGYINFLKQSPTYGHLVCDNHILFNVRLQETEVACLPIDYYDTKNKGYLSFNALMKELEEKGVLSE